MNTLVILIIFLFYNLLYLWRSLRCLSIIQQKEYRVDRLRAFLKTEEAQRELRKYWPSLQDLSYHGLKRPKLTWRSLSVLGFFFIIKFFVYDLIAWQVLQSDFNNWLIVLITALVWYQLLPLLLFVASLPSALGRLLVATYYLWRAKKLLKQHHPLIIGITGSYGKTTSKFILAEVLKTRYSVFVTPKSFNNFLSFPKAIANLYHGEEIMILEYAAYGRGEIARLAKHFIPDLAIVTGFTPQHLALFGSVDAILQAKAELVKAVKDKNKVYANADDPQVLKICQLGGARQPIAYSQKDLVGHLDSRAYLSFNWQGKIVKTPLLGKQYLQALALAIKVGQALNISSTQFIKAVENLVIPERFVQLRQNAQQALLIDDSYSSNPKGFKAALAILKHFKQLNYQTVLLTNGMIDLGEQSNQLHQDLAQAATAFVDQVYYLGNDGLEVFKKIFNKRLSQNQEKAMQVLAKSPAKTAILIEGRMSKKINKFLLSLAKVTHDNF